MFTELELIQQARAQYRAAFMNMATTGGRWHVYASPNGILLDREGANFRILVNDVHAMAEQNMVNALSLKIRMDKQREVDTSTGNRRPRKTAKVNVHHVFGTKSTTAYRVEYRGKLLKTEMGNETVQTMCDKARKWAHENGFTHCEVSYG